MKSVIIEECGPGKDGYETTHYDGDIPMDRQHHATLKEALSYIEENLKGNDMGQ